MTINQAVELGSLLLRSKSGTRQMDWEGMASTIREICDADLSVVMPCDPNTDPRCGKAGIATRIGSPDKQQLQQVSLNDALLSILRCYRNVVVRDLQACQIEMNSVEQVNDEAKLSEDDQATLRELLLPLNPQIRSFISFSLEGTEWVEGASCPGFIMLGFFEPKDFSPEYLLLARLLSVEIGAAYVASVLAHRVENLTEHLNQMKKQSEELRGVSSAVKNTVELERVASDILDRLGEQIAYKKAALQLIQGDVRVQIAGRGFESSRDVPDWALRRITDDPLIQQIVNSKQTTILSHASWPSQRAQHVRSWIGLPLVSEDKVIGLITIDHDQPGFYQPSDELLRTLRAFGDTATQDILDVRLFMEPEKRLRDLEIVNLVAESMGRNLETESLLKIIVTEVATKLQCAHCAFFLAESSQQSSDVVLRPKVYHDQRPRRLREFKVSEGLVGWVYQHGMTLRLSDASTDERFAPRRMQSSKPLSMLLVPVKINDQTIGVISADQDAYGWFSRSGQRLVEALARHAGIAIERASALELLRNIGKQILRTTEMRTTLQEIVTGAVKLTHTSSGVIYLVKACEGKYAVTQEFQYPPTLNHPTPRLNQNKGITYEVLTTGTSVIISDTSSDARVNPELLQQTESGRIPVRSIIAVPLVLGSDVIGVLYLNDNQLHRFSEIEHTVLQTLADQAAIAIEKAEGYERLSEDLREQIKERQAAYEKLELAQAEKLAAEQLVQANALGMQFAHFLNNIAGTIPARANEIRHLLGTPSPPHGEIVRHLEWISANGARLFEFTKMMKRSYSEQTVPSLVSVNRTLESVWDQLKSGLHKDQVSQIECRFDLCIEDPHILAYTANLEEAFSNLLRNAVRAMPNGGEIRVASSIRAEMNKSVVYIQIRDSGIGIDAQDLSHVFDPFFRRAADGLGMGLWLARNTFSLLGGEINITSVPGTGTTVHIFIPYGRD